MQPQIHRRVAILFAALAAVAMPGCTDASGLDTAQSSQSCMKCHNGSLHDDYSGPGLENPHPFGAADNLQCTTCHGGNAAGADEMHSHVPPPPEVGDRDYQALNTVQSRRAWFNKLTLAGMDKFADYTVDGVTYTALDYLQFINPGDLRVVTRGRSCGQCHQGHAETTQRSLLATEAGIFAGSTYTLGVDSFVVLSRGLYDDTASDLSFRAVTNPNYVADPSKVGAVGEMIEQPVHSVFGRTATDQIFNNNLYLSGNLPSSLNANNQVISNSPLADLFMEQVSFTCGDCHLGSSGANNRAGDFRSAGCTACHMPYSLGGRSGSRDPNVPRTEPLNPDAIDEPERPHVRGHRIRSVAKTLANGQPQQGIDDLTCAGCHQGSNRTVMQYWGIRLDQNQDLRNRVQYPADPVEWHNTSQVTEMFDPAVGNRTFNGRNANQYILFEDYDGDHRDDTPADVHYEAGLGCIDCHGSFDLHGGDVTDAANQPMLSHMEQAVAIRCEDCHGSATAYATTTSGTTYDGRTADLAVDSKGNVMKHVERDGNGDLWLTSRLDGRRHFVRQTRDTIVDSGKLNPVNQEALYSSHASYAMGRSDGNASTGIGPQQTGGALNGFSHMDNMNCAACHSAWTNSCVGCHLIGDYNTGNNFSNITGERIVYRQRNADFVYQTPVPFQLGVTANGKVDQFSPNTKVFYSWIDRQGTKSRVFQFSDRNGAGNNPARAFPSMSHNSMLAHSIRGKVTATNEGARQCVACHLTDSSIATYGAQYTAFRTAMANHDYGSLDYNLLKQHIGQNPGNQIDSPIWVHMVAGLGSGLFLFDENGAAVNPLDDNPNRFGSDGVAPSTVFSAGRVRLDLDRIVEGDGVANGSNNHSFLVPGPSPLRNGAADPTQPGPLGSTLIQRLTDPATGIVLNSWFDADAQPHGNVSTFVPN